MSAILPTFFLSHGGGPWPWMKDEMPGVFDKLEASLAAIPQKLSVRPQAILIITAHWIERGFAVSGNPKPGMIYDFGGFPAHTYHAEYPAPGSPELARQVEAMLKSRGFAVRLDMERGLDHGTYTPLVPMFPKADVPIVQLSVDRRFDPETHMRLGQALEPLRRQGVLIIGSGLSFHNLGLFGAAARQPSKEFDLWLQETVAAPPEERWKRLLHWSSAPSARRAHPREDHLIPLMVAVGAAENATSTLVYHEEEFMGGWCVSSFQFGDCG